MQIVAQKHVYQLNGAMLVAIDCKIITLQKKRLEKRL